MTDDEIRARVRAGLADGTLPQEQPVIAQPIVRGQPTTYQMVGRSALPHPCAVCRVQAPTQFWYPQARIAFHERCHAIWREEADKLW